ncbi:alpha/beta fold hydrolase [Lapillicoccus sp.]|uniref:alpha/beta fold hydrolase n=1 Tax=Lapillicoccus sp. TaxID=1909287 RepID=UPI003264623C
MLLDLPDGRQLDVLVSGPDHAVPFVFHHGTPGSVLQTRVMRAATLEHGMRLVTFARPGYGASSRLPGRRVVDVAADVEIVLDHLGAERAVVAGWSGGGPHALATSARLTDRVAATVLIASVAPCGDAGIPWDVWLLGMGDDNLDEFGCAARGEEPLRAYLDGQAADLREADPHQIMANMASLLPPVDRAALTDEFGDELAAAFHEGLRNGVDGWLDDDLAFVEDWGFDLDEGTVPTYVWQGSADLMVPFAHGQWLSERLPRAIPHLEVGEGHLSIAIDALDRMLDEAVTHI